MGNLRLGKFTWICSEVNTGLDLLNVLSDKVRLRLRQVWLFLASTVPYLFSRNYISFCVTLLLGFGLILMYISGLWLPLRRTLQCCFCEFEGF